MAKLRLDLDALDVDSFDLSAATGRGGTAHAHRAHAAFAENTRDTNCLVTCDPMYDSCQDTCVGHGVCPATHVPAPVSGGIQSCDVQCVEEAQHHLLG